VDTLPSYVQGHLVVAAIRLLVHLEQRPPSDERVAELLAVPREEVAHWARGLHRHGAIRIVTSPFETRYEIADHTRLESLPREHEKRGLAEEVESFKERHARETESLKHLFGTEKDRKKESLSKLEEELNRFKSTGRARSPFQEDD
jgi:DNA-directed RNA polymerase specialized sigma subunit